MSQGEGFVLKSNESIKVFDGVNFDKRQGLDYCTMSRKGMADLSCSIRASADLGLIRDEASVAHADSLRRFWLLVDA